MSDKDERSFVEKINDYKSTPEFAREQFYNKSRLKLILIVFPFFIGLSLLLRKSVEINGYTFYLIIILLAILIVNFGAEYLTRKKFKIKEN